MEDEEERGRRGCGGRGRHGRGKWGHEGGGKGGHFERIREAMIERRDIFDKNLPKLSPEAQKYAIQIREIFEDKSKDPETVHSEIRAIKQGVSPDIRDELDDHKHRMMRDMWREKGGGEGGQGGWRSRSRHRRRVE